MCDEEECEWCREKLTTDDRGSSRQCKERLRGMETRMGNLNLPKKTTKEVLDMTDKVTSAAQFFAQADQLEKEAACMAERAATIRLQADEMVAEEVNAPAWLKELIVALADGLGISPEEFRARVRIIHPTKADPVLVLDGKPLVAWV